MLPLSSLLRGLCAISTPHWRYASLTAASWRRESYGKMLLFTMPRLAAHVEYGSRRLRKAKVNWHFFLMNVPVTKLVFILRNMSGCISNVKLCLRVYCSDAFLSVHPVAWLRLMNWCGDELRAVSTGISVLFVTATSICAISRNNS